MKDTQKAVDLYLKAVKDHIQMGGAAEIKKAFELLQELDEAKKAGITNDLIMLIGRFNSNEKDNDNDLLDRREYKREIARIKMALLNTVDNVPQKLALYTQVAGLKGWDFEVPDDNQLEKIIGNVSNLYKISWLEKAIKSAKSVCRIVCNDGSMGTGFLIEGNYLITNNHVLPNADMAAGAEIEFNFEEDVSGAQKQKFTYRLDANDFVTNTYRQLDFTRVKVLENEHAEPLSFWGHLNVSNNIVPVKNTPVTIIQHPSGREKHIALTANEVIAVQGNKVLYKTDTEPGSSGSPVFDKNWNVVALHHAGKLLEEGGLRVRETGQRVSANRGIIFKYINEHIAQNAPAIASIPTEPKPTPTVTDVPKDEPVATPPVADTPKPTDATSGLQVFVMYEHKKDKDAVAPLLEKLKTLEGGEKKVQMIDMHEGRTFGKQKDRWEKMVDTTNFILCLITPHFFKTRDKLVDLAQYANEKDALIIPLLVEATEDYNTSILYEFEPLPSSGDFINKLDDKKAAYDEIIAAVKDYLESL